MIASLSMLLYPMILPLSCHRLSEDSLNAVFNAGVALLIKDKYEQNIESIEYINDRILKATLQINQKPMDIISVYAPNTNKPEQRAIEFYEQVQPLLDKKPNNGTIVLLGDLNARIGNKTVAGVQQSFNEDTSNWNQQSDTPWK